MKKALLSAALLTSSGALYGNFTNKTPITKLVLTSYPGEAVAVGQSTILNPEKCPLSYHYVLKANHPYFDKMYASLLAAKMANTPVKFLISGCATEGPVILFVEF